MSQQINLYDPALERKRDWFALSNLVAVGVLLAIVVGGAGYLARMEIPALTAQSAQGESQLKSMREQITALGQQVAGRKPDPRIEQELGVARLLLDARGEVLATLKQRLGPDADAFAEYLRGFARQSVSGLWLTAFSFDAVSGGMEIRGRTIDPALIPEYIQRLNKEPAFQGRAFSALKLTEGKPDPLPGTNVQAAPAAPASPATQVAQKAPFHEFMLIPVKSDGALLTQTPAAGWHG
jgi:hypothetical protein